MSKHDHHFKPDPNFLGVVLPRQETEALRKELEGFTPQVQDYGFTDRGTQKNPMLQMSSRHASELRQHMDACRNEFLEIRDDVWRKREVRRDTPFRHGHPPQPPQRLTDNELRRGEMTQLERIKHRAEHNEEDYKGRS